VMMMTARIKPCDERLIEGRRKKSRQFLDAAETIREFAEDEADVGDVYVTLCVHAGIAAADVLCCRALGHHVQGENHNEAIAELAKVGKQHGKDLRVLLGMKTRAGYSSAPVNVDQRKRAGRAAERLVAAIQ
jgi:hypothetical protein